MKGKYIAIFAVFGFIIFFFSIEARSVDWVFYDELKDGTCLHYYDSQSITRVSKDTLQVWTKTVYTEKGVQNTIKKLGPEYKEVSYAFDLIEFNCSERKSHFLLTTYYNQDRGIIDSVSCDFLPWDFVVPESGDELLFNIVCGGR